MKTSAILLTTLGLALGSLHAQTVPVFINYQGRVTDSAGVGLGTPTPVNRKVIFRIMDAATAGARLWSEQQTVTISNGEFSVLLGQGINAVYNSVTETPLKTTTPLDTVFTTGTANRYLEIVVDNGDNTLNLTDVPITPRQQITSTAYSFRARSADTIAVGSDLTFNGSANYGLGWYGAGRLFNGVAVDGPVLYGNAGGMLGSFNGATQASALRWNALGQVGIGSTTLAGAGATTKLVLQGDDPNSPPVQLNIRGATDTNQRLLIGYNTASNYGSLQAYNEATAVTNLLLNPIGGNVGIGINPPTQALDVLGNGLFRGGSVFATDTNTVFTRSATGKYGQATGTPFDPSTGVLIEDVSTGESGGFFANGNTAAIWSAANTQRIVSFYDEDSFAPPAVPVAKSWIASDGSLRLQGSSIYGHNTAISGSATISGDATISGNATVSGTATISNNATVNGNLKVASTIRMGSETGTSQPPNFTGLMMRRISTTNPALNQVVARTDRCSLERDGTAGGFLIKVLTAGGTMTFAANGIDQNGATVNKDHADNTPPVGNTQVLFTDAQKIGYFQVTFADVFNGYHQTQVTLMRFVNGGNPSIAFWHGTVISTMDQ